MKTRFKFIVTGNIVYNGNKHTISFQVRSTTCINRIIRILCETFEKDVSQVKGVTIFCQSIRCSHLYRFNYNDNENITFTPLKIQNALFFQYF